MSQFVVTKCILRTQWVTHFPSGNHYHRLSLLKSALNQAQAPIKLIAFQGDIQNFGEIRTNQLVGIKSVAFHGGIQNVL